MTTTVTALAQKKETLDAAAIAEPKAGQGVDTLPCGYLEMVGGKAELHQTVEVVEINGDAEDMLNSDTPPHLKYGQLIAMCTTRVGPHTDRGMIAGTIMPALTIGDRAFLLLAARRVSLGDPHHFVELCENADCLDPQTKDTDKPTRSSSLYTISLADIVVKPMPDPMTRSYTVSVPSAGRQVTAVIHPMTGFDEQRIARYKSDKSSMSILARLDEWDGRKVALRPDGKNAVEVLSLVKGLGLGARNALRDHFAAIEGGIDTTLQLECPLCKTNFERELRIDADFFRPSAVLAAWKKRSAS